MVDVDIESELGGVAAKVLDFLCDARCEDWGAPRPAAMAGNAASPSAIATNVSRRELLWQSREYIGIRVEGTLPFPPTVLLAVIEHEMFLPDEAITWRKVMTARVSHTALLIPSAAAPPALGASLSPQNPDRGCSLHLASFGLFMHISPSQPLLTINPCLPHGHRTPQPDGLFTTLPSLRTSLG